MENETQKFNKFKLKSLATLLELEFQKISDLFFADKFVRKAFKYKCSDSIFQLLKTQRTI
jgi:hypothetical protein